MVNQNQQDKTEIEFDEDTAGKFPEVLYETGPNEDLISSLANAYENRRARQVNEWEVLRKRSNQAAV